MNYFFTISKKIVKLLKFIWRKIARYLLKFGVVGAIGYVIDISIFNMLVLIGIQQNAQGFIFTVFGAKIISSCVAIVFNWIGNRYWVFRANRRRDFIREFFEFVFVAVMGTLISLFVLWFSHNVLMFQSLVADNISANVVGLGLGTIFRFVLYRYWVYGHHRTEKIDGAEDQTELAELALFIEPENKK